MADNKIQFKVQAKITDAVFTCRKVVAGEYRLKALLRVYAAVGKEVLIDGEIKETDVPFPFQTEEAAEKYATDKAREFNLAQFHYVSSEELEIKIET